MGRSTPLAAHVRIGLLALAPDWPNHQSTRNACSIAVFCREEAVQLGESEQCIARWSYSLHWHLMEAKRAASCWQQNENGVDHSTVRTSPKPKGKDTCLRPTTMVQLSRAQVETTAFGRFLAHLLLVLTLCWKSSTLVALIQPFERSLANDFVHLMLFVDAANANSSSSEAATSGDAQILPHFLLEKEEQVAVTTPSDFFNQDSEDLEESEFVNHPISPFPVGVLFTIAETRLHLHGVVRNYLALNELSVQHFVNSLTPVEACGTRFNSTMPWPEVLVQKRTRDAQGAKIHQRYVITGTNESEWPEALRLDQPPSEQELTMEESTSSSNSGNSNKTREFFDELEFIQLKCIVGICGDVATESQETSSEMVRWWVLVTYDLASQGHLEVVMTDGMMVRKRHDDEEFVKLRLGQIPRGFWNSHTFLNVLLVFLLVVYESADLLLYLRERDPKDPQDSESDASDTSPDVALVRPPSPLSRASTASFRSSTWFWIVLFSNLLTFETLVESWRYGFLLMVHSRVCLFFASCCALQCMSLVRYFQVNRQFQMLWQTLARGFPHVTKFLVGVLPLFIGFVMFGTIVFGTKTPRFQDFGTTATTLFSIANGDEIHDTFHSVAATPLVGQLYVYCYMILFSYVVLMVCIGIMEDAFFATAFPVSWPQRSSIE